MNRPEHVATAVLFLMLAACAPAGAADPVDLCSATKVKAAGRRAQGDLKCYAKAAKRDDAVDPTCLGGSSGKLATTFTKAEQRGGCETVGDFPAISSDLDEFVDDAVMALPHAPDPDARRCASTKLKATGKKARGFTGCFAKSTKRGEPVSGSCLVGAEGKFVTSFDKAESRGGCTTVDDADSVETIVDFMVAGLAVDLIAVCGDGIAGPGEECDGISDAACPGTCLPACLCGGTCGNGVAEDNEECDDGGTVGGDGCSSDCQLEDTSALCAGVPSVAGTSFSSELVVEGLSAPVHLTAPPLDPHRLFVVERSGVIRVVRDDALLPTPFLNISSRVLSGGEQGLLSLAFDPDYESNGRFFVNYTRNGDGATTIARYQVSGDPDVGDPNSELVLLTVPQFAPNHNGGQLAFNSDGFMYAGMGDGGGGFDPQETGQDDSRLLGKMLRLDVDVDVAPYYAVPADNPNPGAGDPLGLIWAKGLRNPWRFSFDRANDDLYIADVGQGEIEELDYQPAASSGGENYGWDIFEGTDCLEPDPDPDCPNPPTGFTFPIHEYTHAMGRSITGGFVYRGCSLPDLHGTYFFADFSTAFINTLRVVGGAATDLQDVTSSFGDILGISSFGEDARGELYVIGLGGEVRRMIPEP